MTGSQSVIKDRQITQKNAQMSNLLSMNYTDNENLGGSSDRVAEGMLGGPMGRGQAPKYLPALNQGQDQQYNNTMVEFGSMRNS